MTALSLPGKAGIGQSVYRCSGNCSAWNPAKGERPQDHGRFAVPHGTENVVCPECGAPGVPQMANGSNDDRSDNYVDQPAEAVLSGEEERRLAAWIGLHEANPEDRANA